jgi:hypothetical protein
MGSTRRSFTEEYKGAQAVAFVDRAPLTWVEVLTTESGFWNLDEVTSDLGGR